MSRRKSLIRTIRDGFALAYMLCVVTFLGLTHRD